MVTMTDIETQPFGVSDAPNPQQWIGPRAACDILNVSSASLYRLVEAGDITVYRPETGNGMYWRPQVETFAASGAFQERRRRRV